MTYQGSDGPPPTGQLVIILIALILFMIFIGELSQRIAAVKP